MPSDDEATVRDADGLFKVVGKCFNAFAAEQWLDADGDGRDPAQARSADAPATGSNGVAALSVGAWHSIDIDDMAFDEDRARRHFVSALTAPPGCRAKFVLDERALARLGYSC